MEHVFVETNWLVGCLAPAHQKVFAAVDLLERAKNGDVRLYLPAICVAECQRPIRERFQVKSEADRVRSFLLWAKTNNAIEPDDESVVRRTLDKMEGLVKRDLSRLTDALKHICQQQGVEVFPLEERMWVRTAELSYAGLSLQPFDQAILGAILVKAEMLGALGIKNFAFCELDSDLQPWGQKGESKQSLTNLYDQRGIWVYGDFLMQSPAMPEIWPVKQV